MDSKGGLYAVTSVTLRYVQSSARVMMASRVYRLFRHPSASRSPHARYCRLESRGLHGLQLLLLVVLAFRERKSVLFLLLLCVRNAPVRSFACCVFGPRSARSNVPNVI